MGLPDLSPLSRPELAALIIQAAALIAREVPAPATSPKLLTLHEAAAVLRIAPGTLENRGLGGSQPFASFRVKVGRRTLYDADRIAAWLRDPGGYDSRRAEQAPAPAGPRVRPAPYLERPGGQRGAR